MLFETPLGYGKVCLERGGVPWHKEDYFHMGDLEILTFLEHVIWKMGSVCLSLLAPMKGKTGAGHHPLAWCSQATRWYWLCGGHRAWWLEASLRIHLFGRMVKHPSRCCIDCLWVCLLGTRGLNFLPKAKTPVFQSVTCDRQMQVLNEMRLGIVSEKAKAMLESCHARWPKSHLSNDCMSVVNLQGFCTHSTKSTKLMSIHFQLRTAFNSHKLDWFWVSCMYHLFFEPFISIFLEKIGPNKHQTQVGTIRNSTLKPKVNSKPAPSDEILPTKLYCFLGFSTSLCVWVRKSEDVGVLKSYSSPLEKSWKGIFWARC